MSNIEPSRFKPGTAYITVNGHQEGQFDPWVYKTADYGASWTLIVNGLPRSPVGYARCVREDPKRPGLLYLGTESALYVSFDDGARWEPLQLDLPHAPVSWLTVQQRFADLVIATYGRGVWILDDVTPLREMTQDVVNADAHLFTMRPAYRFRAITAPATPYDDPTVGQSPPYGADINYYLKSSAAGPVRIQIQDAKGQAIRSLDGPGTPGIHRVYWDLRDAPSTHVTLRTSPLYAPEVRIGADGIREGEAGGGAEGGLTVLQAPGAYTVKLTVGGRDYTRPLRVVKDPHSAGTEADIAAQQQFLSSVRRDLDAAVEAVNNAELVRGQIRNLRTLTQDRELLKPIADLDEKIIALEGQLLELRTTGRGQDGVRFGSKLVQKIAYLANGLQSADFKPTNQQLAVQKDLEAKLKTLQDQIDGVLTKDVAAFNERMKGTALPGIAPPSIRR